MLSQLISAIVVIVVGVGGCVAYFWGHANKLVDLIFPSRGVKGAAAIDNLRRQGLVRPWLFIGPALLILIIYLIYPVINTVITSFQDKSGEGFVGLANYQWAFGDAQFLELDPEQPPVVARRSGRLHLPGPDHGPDRQDSVGHHRQELDLPAPGSLLRGRQRHLEVRL